MYPSPNPAPFNSAHVRATIVKILLIVGAVATALSLVVESISLALEPLSDDQALVDNPMGAVLVLVMFLLAVFEFIVYVTTVVFFLMWLYRAANNLRAFDPWVRPTYSPGWAVGYFFIPFINLVVPYRAVKEVWQKSALPDEVNLDPSPPATFPLWWMFWLLACFSGNISMRLSFNEKVPESTATIVSIFASALSIIAAFFVYLVIDAIDKRQEETSRKINLGKLSGPPPPPSNLSMPQVDVADIRT